MPGLFDLVWRAVADEDPDALAQLEKILAQPAPEQTTVH
jgi:hypothetical protein